jgi:gas vesicle protein
MSAGKAVFGTLAALAIGALAGVLLAPGKGSVTRKKIMYNSDDYVDKLKSEVNDLHDSVAEKFESIKKDVQSGKRKSKIRGSKKDVKEVVKKHKHQVATSSNLATS